MEEIRLEEKKDQDDQTERKETMREKLTRALYGMTIEPMMFLQGLGWCMTSISQTQMLLYKTCRGKIYMASSRPGPATGQVKVISLGSMVKIKIYLLDGKIRSHY